MSLIKSILHQLGMSSDPTKNFTIGVPAVPDGTMKLARGNAGATTQDIMTVDANGAVGLLGGATSDVPLTNIGGVYLNTNADIALSDSVITVISQLNLPAGVWDVQCSVLFSGTSADCTQRVVSGSFGAGTSWTDDECGIRETARSFQGLGLKDDGLSVLCTSKYAAAAPSCKKDPAPELK